MINEYGLEIPPDPKMIYNNTSKILDVKPSGIKEAGNGIYTFENLKNNEFIGYYQGKMTKYDENVCVGDYSFSVNEKYYINSASYPRCYMAMINDAQKSKFKNNCEFKLEEEDENGVLLPVRKRRIGLWASEDIDAGSELFASYGDEYWVSR